MMDLADKILPNLLLLGNVLDLTESSMVVGHSEGQFHLVSITRQGSNIVQESLIIEEGWDAFLRRVADEMAEVFVPSFDMLDLEGLERSAAGSGAQEELVLRAKKALKDFNQICNILRSNEIGSEISVHEFPMTGENMNPKTVSVKFTKEIK